MADLTDIQATEATRIVGSSPTGVEQTPVKASANGDLATMDICDAGGVQGAITVGTTPVAVRVGGANLPNRKVLTATNTTTQILNTTLYWGYTNTVTTATGTPLEKSAQAVWAAGENTTIYLVAAAATHNVRVTEGA